MGLLKKIYVIKIIIVIMYPRLSRKVMLVVTFWITMICAFAENNCRLETFAISPLYINSRPKDDPLKVVNISNTRESAVHCYWISHEFCRQRVFHVRRNI